MQSPCALYAPHYTVQALRARGKRAVSRPTSHFRVASYCRRVVLVCDWHGIGGGGKHCTLRAEAAAYAILARSSTRITQVKRACSRLVRFMSPTILSRRYAPAASVQSVVLPHAFGLPAIVAGWTWCATSMVLAAAASTATTPLHSLTHRRLRQALLRQRCTARPLFTRSAWPRRALRLPTRTT
jgi:hypothetical protein